MRLPVSGTDMGMQADAGHGEGAEAGDETSPSEGRVGLEKEPVSTKRIVSSCVFPLI